jgi:hypothetical protein
MKLKNILSIVLIIFSLLLLFAFFFVVGPLNSLYRQAKPLSSDIALLKQSINNKDLQSAKNQLLVITSRYYSLNTTLNRLSYFRFIPYLNYYYQDCQKLFLVFQASLETTDILIQAIEPYQDFLGLKGSSSSGAKTTQDRIDFLTKSVEGLMPFFDQITQKLSAIRSNLEQINPQRYPIKYRPYFFTAFRYLDQILPLIQSGKPLLEKTPWLLGKSSPRTYFLIFQNNTELRPTGGFWTAYGLIRVKDGQITPLLSEDIYALDARFNSQIPAPRPIKAYHINVPYWNLRDFNLSPDFPTSIKLFLEQYQKISPQNRIDAVIAIDTQVLVDLVKILGQIGVPGWGNFSAQPDSRCDGCPQIIYQLEWFAGRPRNYLETNRKGFLSPLIHSLLANAMGSEKSKITPLITALFNNIRQKNLLFYFLDPNLQQSAQALNLSGSIASTPAATDYFHLNDANMSSAKTNLFLTQKIKHEINLKNQKVDHKITITYTNPSRASNCNLEKGELCLNAPKYRNWFRFYVSPGSQLIKMTGSEVEPLIYDELGKKVFEGFYGDKYPLYPLQSSIVSLHYQSAVSPHPSYTLFLQKQPGTKPINYELLVNNQPFNRFTWSTDLTININF